MFVVAEGSFILNPTDVSTIAGHNAMFECLTNGFPTAEYSWTKNGVTLSTSNRVLIHGRFIATCVANCRS